MPWMTVKEAAQLEGVSAKTIRRRIKKRDYKTEYIKTGVGRGAKELRVLVDDSNGQSNGQIDENSIESNGQSNGQSDKSNGQSDKSNGQSNGQSNGHQMDTVDRGVHLNQPNQNQPDTENTPVDEKNALALKKDGHLSEKQGRHFLKFERFAQVMGLSDKEAEAEFYRLGPQEICGQRWLPMSVLDREHQDAYLALVGIDRGDSDMPYYTRKEKEARLKVDLARIFSESPGGAAKQSLLDHLRTTHPEIYAVTGKPRISTVYEWARILKRGGDYRDLMDTRGLKGSHSISELELEAALSILLDPTKKLKIATGVKFVHRLLDDLGIAHVSQRSAERAVKNWCKKHQDAWILAREGEQALEARLPYVLRDWSNAKVGDILMADGKVLNVQCIDPRTGKPKRGILVVFFDVASRMPAGWSIGMTENMEVIYDAFRHACINLGKIPRAVILDNGRAFKAKIFTSKVMRGFDFETAGVAGIFERVGVEVVHFALPYNAKTKSPVERHFGTLCDQLERLLPSFIGASIADKPARLRRNERIHQKWFAEIGANVPSLEIMDQAVFAWVYQWYAVQDHDGLDGEKPLDVWQAGRGPGVDERKLDYLLMTIEERTIRNCAIRFNSILYAPKIEERGILSGLSEKVRVRYSIHNWDVLKLYYKDTDKFICDVVPIGAVDGLWKLLEDEIAQGKVKETVKSTKKAVRSGIKRAKQTVEDYARIGLDADVVVQVFKGSLASPSVPLLPADDDNPDNGRVDADFEIVIDEEEDSNEPPLFTTERGKFEWLLEHPDRWDQVFEAAEFFREYMADEWFVESESKYKQKYGGQYEECVRQAQES